MRRLLALALTCASCNSCKDDKPPPVQRPAAPGQTGTASVRGTVRLRGTPPPAPRVSRGSFAGCGKAPPRAVSVLVSPGGGVAETFVWVKRGIPDGDYPIPSDPVVVDQRGCEFVPRVAGVRAGQPVAFRNADETLHNVHAVGSGSNRFNFGMPLTGMEVKRQLTEPQVMVTIACDVHPWMRAWLGVVRHPFFAVTGADGSYALTGLPGGTFVVEAWQKAVGHVEQTVTGGRPRAAHRRFDVRPVGRSDDRCRRGEAEPPLPRAVLLSTDRSADGKVRAVVSHQPGDSMNEWLNVIFRWTHLAAGVMWIGHLWFFNFVNAQLAKTYDPDSRKKVLPELMPRALYWFRWGAAYTWITGILLLFLVYWFGGVMVNPEQKMGPHAAGGIGLVLIVVGFFVYDVLWKSLKNEKAGAAISFVLVAVFAYVLTRFMSGRAMYIHVGGLLGTIMAANVWMRIWPAQRKIIAGVKGTAPAPDASVVALAGLRSKHNTYMSMPLMFMMVSNHFPTLYGSDLNWVILMVLVAVGWGVTKLLYQKSATPAPAQF
ncbi:MAG TPA: urate hydroxylase PuuD [Myxococcales bacterium]|nr:urate hydroxylase PuuD [Myxococcales bacterium]